MDTRVAIKMMVTIRPGFIYIYINTGFQCFNVTQGHKPSYPTSYISIPMDGDVPTWLYFNTGFKWFNATQGHTPSYISIPNDGDNPTCLSKQGFSLAIHKVDIDPKLQGMIHLNTSFRVSVLLSLIKHYTNFI